MKFTHFSAILPLIAGVAYAKGSKKKLGKDALPTTAWIQLSSNDTQVNGDIGSGGIDITYNSIDALSPTGISFNSGDSSFTVNTAGAYFVLGAPQIGGVDPANPDQTANYYMRQDGGNVEDSNVQYKSATDHKDVIICQGVIPFAAGSTFGFVGSGDNSQTEFISPSVGPVRPVVPSIITSAFQLPLPDYAQMSSTVTQRNGVLGEGTPVTFDTSVLSGGISFDGFTKVIASQPGAYFIIAAPQVGSVDPTVRQVADYWVRVNGVNVGNSNVQYDAEGHEKDVIVCQGVYELEAGSEVEVMASGLNSFTERIDVDDEPLVPSIIFSMFKLKVGGSYAQLSSTDSQQNYIANSPDTPVAITFNSVDALSDMTVANTGITLNRAGTYFILAAPQVGAKDSSGEFYADYWIRINGEDVANTNVEYLNNVENKDVIVCQGVYQDLNAGDFIQVMTYGDNSQTLFIPGPCATGGDCEPDVPSIIFSIMEL